MNTKLEQRQKIRYRIRKKISGTASKPRLSVFRSNSDIYAQLIDDDNAVTLAASSSREKDILAQKIVKTEKSKLVGAAIALKAKELGLGVNAGHDLDLHNLKYFAQNITWLDEVSIGHALVCDALYLGYENAVQLYKRQLNF